MVSLESPVVGLHWYLIPACAVTCMESLRHWVWVYLWAVSQGGGWVELQLQENGLVYKLETSVAVNARL